MLLLCLRICYCFLSRIVSLYLKKIQEIGLLVFEKYCGIVFPPLLCSSESDIYYLFVEVSKHLYGWEQLRKNYFQKFKKNSKSARIQTDTSIKAIINYHGFLQLKHYKRQKSFKKIIFFPYYEQMIKLQMF